LFFETAAELVQNLNEQAMHLEKSPGDGETVRGLRRTVHTLKGDARRAVSGTERTGAEFEDVLTLENPRPPLVPDVALRAADVFGAARGYRRKKLTTLSSPVSRNRPAGSSRHGWQVEKKCKRALSVAHW
jgi:hypothetical protein